jgi:glycosyltransferase involved in cell wall biosynthesis
MKIALVIKSLSLSGGGAERFSRNLIRGLLARGHKISVFCFDWDDGTEQLGISLHKIPKLSKWKHPWFDFSEKVHQKIKDTGDFDVVFGLTQLCPQYAHRLGGGIYRYWYELKYGKFLPLQMLRGRVRNALKFEKQMYSPGNYKRLITISKMDKRILQKYEWYLDLKGLTTRDVISKTAIEFLHSSPERTQTQFFFHLTHRSLCIQTNPYPEAVNNLYFRFPAGFTY